MFKKLDVTFTDINVSNLKGNEKFRMLTFSEYNILEKNYLISIVNEKLEFKIKPDAANITIISPPGITPHKDVWMTALNIYISVGDDRTYFWEQDLSKPGYKNGPTFYGKTEPINSFKSNVGDCYLFNTHQIHSVDIKKENGDRYILRLIWYNHSFNEVLNSITIK